MRRLGIENAQLANDIEMYLRQRHHADQIMESLRHGHSVPSVRLGDDIAHVAQHLTSQGSAKLQPRFLHPSRAMQRSFKVQGEGGQTMPQGIVQFMGDAQALGHATAFRENLLQGAQLGVGYHQLSARGHLPGHSVEDKESQQLEAEVRWRQQQRRARIQSPNHRCGEQ